MRKSYNLIIMNSIRTLRKENKMTQNQLALKLGAKQSSISKWELGITLPDTENLIKLAELFNVSIDYVLGISRYHYPVNVGQDNLFTFDELRIIEDYRKLSPEFQANLKQTLTAFVNSSTTNQA